MTSELSFVLEGGHVLSMDPDVGELEGDVVVSDGTIVAVGKAGPDAEGERIDAGGMYVLPGFVDTHRHTWQAALRFSSVGWTLVEYIEGLQQSLAPRFTAEDVYAANLLGALTALEAGITTLRDDSHVQNSFEHGEAAIAALRDSGIRASFGHGWPSSAEYMTDSALPHPSEMERIRNEVLSDDTALVTMHAHLRGPSLSTIEIAVEDLERARALDLRSSIHIGAEIFPDVREVEELRSRDLLGPDLTFVHCCTTNAEDMKAMAAAGCSASVTALIEAVMPGLGRPATARLVANGVMPSFGVDVEVAAGGDLFGVVRAALLADQLERSPLAEVSPAGDPLTAEGLLTYATLGGAEACGLGDRTGSITVGKQADLILLRGDRLNLWSPRPGAGAIVAAAAPGDVDSVFVAGRPRKRGGKLVDVDLEAVRGAAIASVERLRREADAA